MAWLGTAASRTVTAPVESRLLIQYVGTRLLLGAASAGAWAVGSLPRLAVGEPACHVAGTLWYLGSPAARAAVRENMRHVLGREPTPRQVRAVFVHGALNYWDTFALARLQSHDVRALVHMDGREHIDAALAAGRGVILAGAHLGSIAFVGQIVPALGYPMVGLLEQIKPAWLYDFFARERQRLGMRLFPATASAVRELLAALQRNEVLGLVTDRDVTGTGPFVRFFDAPARFADGPAALSLRTGAPILPSVAIRRPDGGFRAVIEAPLQFEPSGDRKRDAVALTQAVAGRLEYHIANHPEQWTVFQRRWPAAAPGSE